MAYYPLTYTANFYLSDKPVSAQCIGHADLSLNKPLDKFTNEARDAMTADLMSEFRSLVKEETDEAIWKSALVSADLIGDKPCLDLWVGKTKPDYTVKAAKQYKHTKGFRQSDAYLMGPGAFIYSKQLGAFFSALNYFLENSEDSILKELAMTDRSVYLNMTYVRSAAHQPLFIFLGVCLIDSVNEGTRETLKKTPSNHVPVELYFQNRAIYFHVPKKAWLNRETLNHDNTLAVIVG